MKRDYGLEIAAGTVVLASLILCIAGEITLPMAGLHFCQALLVIVLDLKTSKD